MSVLCVAPNSLRAFAPTVDVGLVPGEERKAGGLSGERSFWRATLQKGALWLISVMLAGVCFLATSAY